MSYSPDLGQLESDAYRSSYDDGIIDLFVGLSLVWIGVAWMWIPSLAGVAGVFPAILVTGVLAARKRLIEARTGYVRWREDRRIWERRNLWILLTAGTALFLLGVGTFVTVSDASATLDLEWVLPGLLAILLALLALGLVFVTGLRRMAGYAAVLLAAGLVAAAKETNPGMPLLVAGGAITVVGAALLVRFLRRHPAPDAA